MKDRLYEVAEHIFNKFPKYHMKILLGALPSDLFSVFQAKVSYAQISHLKHACNMQR
jgi:hypothetical protein